MQWRPNQVPSIVSAKHGVTFAQKQLKKSCFKSVESSKDGDAVTQELLRPLSGENYQVMTQVEDAG